MSRDKPDGYPKSSSIGKFADQMRDPDPANGRAAAQELRQKTGGKFVVFYTEHLSWPEEARVNQLADEIYGRMKGEKR